jgi:hypothetical protein
MALRILFSLFPEVIQSQAIDGGLNLVARGLRKTRIGHDLKCEELKLKPTADHVR